MRPIRANVPRQKPGLLSPEMLKAAREMLAEIIEPLVEAYEMPGEVYRGERAPSPEDAFKFTLAWGTGTTPASKGPGVGLWRYTGRKKRASEGIVKKLLFEGRDVNTSFEPFGGSFAWTQAAAKQKLAKHYRGGDVDREVINIFRQVKRDPEGVAKGVKQLLDERDAFARALGGAEGQKEASKALYRSLLEREHTPKERAIKHLAIGNRTWSYEPGKTPRGWLWGTEKGRVFSPTHTVIDDILRFGKQLQEFDIDIARRGFEKTLQGAGKGDFIFVDSPYMGSVTKYTSGKWSLEDELKLAEALKAAREKGASGVLYNYEEVIPLHPYVDEWRPSSKKLGRERIGFFGDIWK